MGTKKDTMEPEQNRGIAIEEENADDGLDRSLPEIEATKER